MNTESSVVNSDQHNAGSYSNWNLFSCQLRNAHSLTLELNSNSFYLPEMPGNRKDISSTWPIRALATRVWCPPLALTDHCRRGYYWPSPRRETRFPWTGAKSFQSLAMTANIHGGYCHRTVSHDYNLYPSAQNRSQKCLTSTVSIRLPMHPAP